MTLPPLFENVRIVEGSGRFPVQLEIPESSTLTEGEIERIIALSTWDTDPNQNVEGYEGGRSVLIEREKPIEKGEIQLSGLQISGIGYLKIHVREKISVYAGDSFFPPCKENFMKRVTGTKMSTSYGQGDKILSTRPEYRALGTYLLPELLKKVEKTQEVSQLVLEKMVVPHVEAYGRYLTPELANEDGPFGFVIFPVPSGTMQRIVAEAVKEFTSLDLKNMSGVEAIMAYYAKLTPNICPFFAALRELHDTGYVHLQTHLSNLYVVDGTPYVMDWSTMRKLGNDPEENIANRVLDIKKPADNYDAIFSDIFSGAPGSLKLTSSALMLELMMEIYSGDCQEEINVLAVGARARQVYGRDVTDLEAVIQWMKDQGFEGFPKYKVKPMPRIEYQARLAGSPKSLNQSEKVGRNSPCPCGSGKKYKHCCGKEK